MLGQSPGKVRSLLLVPPKAARRTSVLNWTDPYSLPLPVLVTALQDEPDLTRPSSIVCFGLGSVVQSRIAQLQLLLMLDLAARFEVRTEGPLSTRSFEVRSRNSLLRRSRR